MRVDLRSDTVTRPTAAMREAIAAAEVGDDVYGEDPTINALEAEVAAIFGHEAALFTPSGTMANQIAIQLLVSPGNELLCDADAHVVNHESGAAAAYGGVSTRTWSAAGAHLDPQTIAAMIRPAGYHAVTTAAIAVEQTHNLGGGTVIPLATLQELRRVADAAGAALHCDGARIWHAHVADQVPLAEYGAQFDTLSVCLSKGLGAPVGSLVVSSTSGSPGPGRSATGSAAPCARPGCWPRPGATPCATTSTGSPTTTPAPPASPRRWHRTGWWTRPRSVPTSSCSTSPRRRLTARRWLRRPASRGCWCRCSGRAWPGW